jgi:hypothetical protein
MVEPSASLYFNTVSLCSGSLFYVEKEVDNERGRERQDSRHPRRCHQCGDWSRHSESMKEHNLQLPRSLAGVRGSS